LRRKVGTMSAKSSATMASQPAPDRLRKAIFGRWIMGRLAEIREGMAGIAPRASVTISWLFSGRSALMLQLVSVGGGMVDCSTVAGLSFDIGTAASSRILRAVGGARSLRFESMML